TCACAAPQGRASRAAAARILRPVVMRMECLRSGEYVGGCYRAAPGTPSRFGRLKSRQMAPGTATATRDFQGIMRAFATLTLSELRARFGNLGLAAAAYNGGPARVENWLEGRSALPGETRNYVSLISGRTADDWRSAARDGAAAAEGMDNPPTRCLILVAAFR